MHVVVVGAGEVGMYVAERLSREGHDVALVESDAARLREAEERLDVQTIHGSGASPVVLGLAGTAKADLVVSVTNDDSANLVVAATAKHMGEATTVIRLQSDDLRSPGASALRRSLGVDVLIDPDLETAEEILQLLRFPGATDIHRMMGGEVLIVGVRLPEDAWLVGKTLSDIAMTYEPHWDFLIGVISRGQETIIPREDVRLEAGDHVRFVCNLRGRRQVLKAAGLAPVSPRNVMLLGGGHTARILAERLSERGARPIIVERNPRRARDLAERLDRALVLEGEITDADLLAIEGVAHADVVCALTGSDDANILACLFAKANGAKETIAVVHKLSLLSLVHEVGIDVAVSPRTAIANAVLRYVRGGGIASVTTFLGADAEIVELQVEANSLADGSLVAELPLPRDVLIGAVVRSGNAEIARGRTRLRHQDRVVAFAMPGCLPEVQRLFSSGQA